MDLTAASSAQLQKEGMNGKKPKKPSIGQRLVKPQIEPHNMITDTGASVVRPKLRNFYRPEGRYSTEKI